jgi:cytochrome b subunit of formate dehydrogenase
MDTKTLGNKEVYRFSLIERISHGVHGVAFIVLLFGIQNGAEAMRSIFLMFHRMKSITTNSTVIS